MNDWKWYVIDVNPVPWAIGPITTGRRGGRMIGMVGRNVELRAYQDAVREIVREQLSGETILDGPVEMKLFFWRKMEEYTSPQGRGARNKEADLTNLQKAIEDAVQKILLTNDKNVKKHQSEIVEQHQGVNPMAVLAIRPYRGFDPSQLPSFVWEKMEILREKNESYSNQALQWPFVKE